MSDRHRPSLSCSPPRAFAFAALILIACGSPIVARMQLDGIRFALPFLLGVAIHAMAVNRCDAPADLWKIHSLAVASLGVFMTLLLTSVVVGNINAPPSLYVTYGAAIVAAGARPVVAAFFLERRRARLDSQDTFFAAGGVWAMNSGLVTLLMIRVDAPIRGALLGAHRIASGVGIATLALGAALSLVSVARSRRRLRWLRLVAEGKVIGYRFGTWDSEIDTMPPRLLDHPVLVDQAEAGRVLFRGSEADYRGQAHEALGLVSGLGSASRASRWIREAVAGTVVPLLLTSWLFLCSFARGSALKGL